MDVLLAALVCVLSGVTAAFFLMWEDEHSKHEYTKDALCQMTKNWMDERRQYYGFMHRRAPKTVPALPDDEEETPQVQAARERREIMERFTAPRRITADPNEPHHVTPGPPYAQPDLVYEVEQPRARKD